jgi:hypothetical protein
MFIDSGGEVFENIKDVSIIDAYSGYEVNNKYFGGLDYGSVGDNSVLTIVDKNRAVVSLTVHSGDYTKQLDEMLVILKLYKPILYAEANSMGLPNINFLKKHYSNVKEFYTTNSSKKDIIEALKLAIYKKEIELPSPKLCPILNKELNNYTFSMTKTGLITYHHRPGEHDDTVMSLAISNYCYNQHNKGFKAISINRSNFH